MRFLLIVLLTVSLVSCKQEPANKETQVAGPVGPQGPKGDKGERGLQGEKGDKGDRGENGDEGGQGLQGIQGIQGVQGIQGIQGIQGAQGPRGKTPAIRDSAGTEVGYVMSASMEIGNPFIIQILLTNNLIVSVISGTGEYKNETVQTLTFSELGCTGQPYYEMQVSQAPPVNFVVHNNGRYLRYTGQPHSTQTEVLSYWSGGTCFSNQDILTYALPLEEISRPYNFTALAPIKISVQ